MSSLVAAWLGESGQTTFDLRTIQDSPKCGAVRVLPETEIDATALKTFTFLEKAFVSTMDGHTVCDGALVQVNWFNRTTNLRVRTGAAGVFEKNLPRYPR